MRRWDLWTALAIGLAGLLVYANSLQGPFIFDDHYSIVESANVRTLWPLSESMGAPAGSVASGRPVVALSLALNYAWGELDVFGYHLVNVLAHALTALALFGLLRRSLLRTDLRPQALPLAALSALVWAVHPLNTDALNQVVSRSEVFAAGFYLAAAYAAERSFESPLRRRWQAAAVLACAAAMGSKELAVSLPLFVLAYDRTLVSGSFAAALRRRRGFYAALAATWLVLGLAIASGDRGVTVGFGQEVTSWDYLRTQAEGIPHYLGLALWPRGLAIDYSGWPLARGWSAAVVLSGLFVILLFLGSCWLFVRRRPESLPALLFFAVLAPSSSFIPLAGERLAEHRMYLPLAALLALAAPLIASLARRLSPARGPALAGGLLLLLSLPLAWATVRRNTQYASAQEIWEDTLEKYPRNGRAHDQLAAIHMAEGRYAEALRHAEQAVRLAPELNTVDYNLATVLMMLGEFERSLRHFERAEVHRAGVASFHGNYGMVLGQSGQLEPALHHLRRALEIDPDYAPPRRNLGILLAQAGRSRQALPHLRRALATRAEPELLLLLGRILASDPDPGLRDGQEALGIGRGLVQQAGPDPRWLDLVGMAQAELGSFDEAADAAQRALEGARAQRREPLAREIEERLALYRAGRPYRSPRRP